MTADPLGFSDLMCAVLAGNPAAAEQFCNDYGSHIRRVVRHRLMPQMRAKFDSIDFVHDVWASFFAQPPRHLQFDRPETVVAYLEQMAKHKVREAVRQRTRLKKYNINRERPLPEPAAGSFAIPLPAPGPTPSQVVSAEEQWQLLLDGQPAGNKRILRLLRRGWTHREIADKLQTSEKTVQRLVRRLDPRTDP
jgi:RNA polymerase sigma-70 factor (ECF subfamily)